MSKVISFSISDKYLEKLRTLYPALTDNLAAKQFLTDRLDSSLGSSLDGSLYGDLDGKIKTIIETSLDGLLEGRLDAAMGKLLTSLSERMARLEERLDTNLDGGLDEMELLLRMQREASITSLIPTGEPSPLPPSPDEPVRPAIEDSEKKIIPLPDTLIVSPIETVESGSESISSINEPDTDAIETLPTVETVEPISTIETVASAIEDSEKKIMEPVGGSDSLDTLPVPPITDKTIDQNAIETVPGEGDSVEPVTGEGMTAVDAAKYLKDKKVKVSDDSLYRWIRQETIPDSRIGKNVRKHLTLTNQLYYPNPD